jgi:dolichol-phosphate mannosyltransferase
MLTSRQELVGNRLALLCTVCLPVYNEGESLQLFLNNLLSCLNHIEGELAVDFELVAVDDGSTDSSLRILMANAKKDCRLKVYAFQQNSGHQAAILCGLSHAQGDIVITMDSDGQDPPEAIEDLIKAYLTSRCEIILAKRSSRKDNFLKIISAWTFYRLLTTMGVPSESRDAGDYRLITKRIKDLILSQPNSLQYIRGQIFTLKTPVQIIKVDRKGRIAGSTKYTLSKMIRLAISSIFVIDPLRVSQLYLTIAFFFTVMSFLLGCAFVGTKLLMPGYYASGIITLALLVLFLFTVVICMIAFQSLYMSLLFRSLRNEPPYLEKSLDLEIYE